MSQWRELIEHWRAVVAEIDPELADPARWEDEPPGHFLHAFRPDGRGIERLFDTFPEAAPVAARLARIFEIAGPETGHMYLIPRERRLKLTDGELVALTNDYLDRLSARAGDELDPSDGDDAFLLSSARDIEVWRGPPPLRDPNDDSSLGSRVTELVIDRASPDHPLGAVLGEPLYMLACRYELRNWVLWPLELASDDPFEPWFHVWAAGAFLSYERNETGGNRVVVIAPPLSPA